MVTGGSAGGSGVSESPLLSLESSADGASGSEDGRLESERIGSGVGCGCKATAGKCDSSIL